MYSVVECSSNVMRDEQLHGKKQKKNKEQKIFTGTYYSFSG
jgi:hypothetical protein